ncbi:MAG: hypothetical protein ACJ8AW_19310 [Rhodopila sp.]
MNGGTISVVAIPIRPSHLIADIRRTRRALRDCRDKTARLRPEWRWVTFGGLASGGHEILLAIQHTGITQTEVCSVLSRRWPEMSIRQMSDVPDHQLGVEAAVAL